MTNGYYSFGHPRTRAELVTGDHNIYWDTLYYRQVPNYLVEVENSTGSPDWIKDFVVDDSIHRESDTVCGQYLLWWDLIHSGPRVNTTYLN